DPKAPAEVERDERVEPEEADLHDRRVEGEAVEVVEDPREGGLAFVRAAMRLRHRARARVPEERPEVRLAVVVAGEPEGERGPRHPDGGGDAGDFDERRVEGAQVRRVR